MTESARNLVLPARKVGRYALYDQVGHGGTATVHLGRLLGPAGFSKTVAVKRMHESVSRDPEVAAMFLDEARISGRIRHPNVVGTVDLLSQGEELFLILEYVHGESLSSLQDRLRQNGQRVPVAVAVHVLRDALAGLHAAHETVGDDGRPLGLVHRDVSPQNIQVSVEGVARVLDFGIAKALGRLQDTHTGQVKGKLAYMAPEQLLGQPVDRRTDVFAAGVVLWEILAGRRLFRSKTPGETVQRVLSREIPLLSELVPEISLQLSHAIARAVERQPERRYATAHDFACALEAASELISPRAVGEWVMDVGGEELERRTTRLREIESAALSQEDGPSARANAAAEWPTFDPDATSTALTAVVAVPKLEAPVAAASGLAPLEGAERTAPRRRLAWVTGALGLAAGVTLLWYASEAALSAPEPTANTASHPATDEPGPKPALVAEAPAPPSTPQKAPAATQPSVAAAPPTRTSRVPSTRPAPTKKTTSTAPKRAEDLFSRN